MLSPVANDGVFRVRLCNDGDSLCSRSEGISQQTVSVWGYAGAQQVYGLTTLNTQGNIDTGPYTKRAGLTRITVRCNSTSTAYCKIPWQACREELPLSAPLIKAAPADTIKAAPGRY